MLFQIGSYSFVLVDSQFLPETLGVFHVVGLQRRPRRIGNPVDSVEISSDAGRVNEAIGADPLDDQASTGEESLIAFAKNGITEL